MYRFTTIIKGIKLHIPPPSYRQYIILRTCKDDIELIDTIKDILNSNVEGIKLEIFKDVNILEIPKFIKEILAWIYKIKSEHKEMQVPYAPHDGSNPKFQNLSSDVKIVADYMNASFFKVWNLSVLDFFGYLHDAIVWNCEKSEAGKEYLSEAFDYEQTEPDRNAIRAKMRGGANNGK